MRGIKLLWRKRISYLLKLYHRFIAFQLDGVILLYTLILILLIGYNYYPILLKISTQFYSRPWSDIILTLTLVPILSGSYRGYLKAADEVFLIPFNSLGKRFVSYSARLSIGLQIGVWSLYVGLWQLITWGKIDRLLGNPVSLLLLGIAVKLINMNLKYIIFHLQGPWLRRILGFLRIAFVWPLAYFLVTGHQGGIDLTLMLIVVGILVFSFVVKSKITPQWTRWITTEVNGRARNMAFLIQVPVKEKSTFRRKTLTVLSGRKLEPFTKRGGLLMLYYRILMRGKGNLKIILSILGVLIGIILFTAEPVALGVSFLFAIFILGNFLFSIWYQLKDDIWIKLYPIPLKDKLTGMKEGPLMLLLTLSTILFFLMLAFNREVFSPLLDLFCLLAWSWLLCEIKVLVLHWKRT